MSASLQEATSKLETTSSSISSSGPRQRSLTVCGYFDGGATMPTRHGHAGISHRLEVGTLEALGRAALRVDPAKSTDFEGAWLPLHASSRLVASRQPRASIQLTAL